MKNILLGVVISAVALIPANSFAKNAKNPQELKQNQFLAVSGLRDVIGSEILDVHIYTHPDSSPYGNLLAACRITSKTLLKLLNDKFFDMWDNNDLPDDILKSTYLSLDYEKDKIPKSVRPPGFDHITWMNLEAKGRTRLYLICRDKDNKAATLYFFFSDLTQ